MQPKRVKRVIDHLMKSREEVKSMVNRSFLSPSAKRAYMLSYRTRYNTLR